MNRISRLAAGVTAALLIAGTFAAPAHAASSSGTRNCTGGKMPYLTSYTFSNLSHRHAFTPVSGNTTTRVQYGTTVTHMSPFQQTKWTASTTSPEAWKSSPVAQCLTAPL